MGRYRDRQLGVGFLNRLNQRIQHGPCRLFGGRVLLFLEDSVMRVRLLTGCKWMWFIMLLTTAAWGQWTEPDTTWVPQIGGGIQAPWISNDNLRLYCSSPRDLYVISRVHPDSAWGEWQLLPPHINSTPTQRCPAESPTGDTLYFIGDVRTDCESYGSYDVFYTVRTGPCDTCWGPVQNPGPDVNSSRREFSVGISRDGSILLVASNRLGTYGAELYWHDKQLDGTWGLANHFGPEINDINRSEEHPCLSPDNLRLLFWRDTPVLNDIWESRRLNGEWQQATRLPAPVNGPGMTREEDPCLSVDGRTLWFRKTIDDGFHYHLVVSVDTSVNAAGRPSAQPSRAQPTLHVDSDSAGNLTLKVEGQQVEGDHTVLVYDLLGRESGRYVVHFSRQGTLSISRLTLPDLPSGTYILSLQLPSGALSAKYVVAE